MLTGLSLSRVYLIRITIVLISVTDANLILFHFTSLRLFDFVVRMCTFTQGYKELNTRKREK